MRIFLKCIIPCLFLLSLSGKLLATHIVGGELSLVHVSGDQYKLGMVMFFDRVNGDPGARDPNVRVGLFRKSDNTQIDLFVLPLRTVGPVEYTNPDCTIGQLGTDRIYYELDVVLPASRYNHPDGYYASFDRCCRNNIIENIETPGTVGQLFYMEFPPVVRNGAPFINSTPRLFPPLSDYACKDQPFYFSYQGSDDDGDSLVYSLAVPMRGFSSDAPDNRAPDPKPGEGGISPYPTVAFLNGYDLNNMIRGTPPLRIDKEGYLTITPSEDGLFVFAIRCEEYRNGVKIGEVRRDFQMLVVNCPDNKPPVITYQPPTPDRPPYVESDTIRYFAGDSDTCLVMNITDASANDVVNVRMRQLTHPSINGITLERVGGGSLENVTIPPGGKFQVQACMPGCSEVVDEVIRYEVIVSDNSCALPLMDTAVITLFIETIPNQPPVGASSLGTIGADGCYRTEAIVGKNLSFDLSGLDPDNDSLRMIAFGSNVDLVAEGIVFNTVTDKARIDAAFSWTPTCDNLGANNATRTVEIFFVVEDFWKCGVKSKDTICVSVDVKFVPEPNATPSPVLSGATFNASTKTYTDTVYFGSEVNYPIALSDTDLDSIFIDAFGEGFSMNSLRMQFESKRGRGTLSTSLRWEPLCSDFKGLDNGDFQEEYTIKIVGTDYNDCFLQSSDTVTLKLIAIFEPDDNVVPTLDVENARTLVYDAGAQLYCDTLTVGEAIAFDVWGTDIDTVEQLFLEAVPRNFDMNALGMTFANQSGIIDQASDSLRSTFSWQTACDALSGGISDTEYFIDFVVRDRNKCELSDADTITVKLIIKDIEQIQIRPFPNAFSPNGDGKGEVFSIDNLPIDNCADSFEKVEIRNRWGKVVYESASRDFAWDGEGAPAGVYYYLIKYRNAKYKGTVTLFTNN